MARTRLEWLRERPYFTRFAPSLLVSCFIHLLRGGFNRRRLNAKF